MATKTTYACDRCGAIFDDRNMLKCVSAGVGDYSGENSWFKSFHQDWCFECLKVLGLPYGWRKDQYPKDDAPTPTLEDMIREIVRSEMH